MTDPYPRPVSTVARCVDALDRVERHARREAAVDFTGTALALDHLCEAIDKVMRNSPETATYLEGHIAAACEAIGVQGP